MFLYNKRNQKGGIQMIKFNGINLLTVKDVSGLIKVTDRTILQYLRDGKIKGQKIGNTWYVTEQNLERYLKGE